MSLKIRLTRGGAKKRPYYRIVVADARSPRDGRFLEKLGFWNPMLAKDNEKRVELNEERVKHWLANGAVATDRVLRFLNEAGLVERAARSTGNAASGFPPAPRGSRAPGFPPHRRARSLTGEAHHIMEHGAGDFQEKDPPTRLQ